MTNKRLPSNPNQFDIDTHFQFWSEAKSQFSTATVTSKLIGQLIIDGLPDSQMVIRWLLFGVVLAALTRTFVDIDSFQTWFGPTLAGLGLTLIATTIIEVYSEGSTPIAADLMIHANAPDNSFTFANGRHFN